MIGLLIWLYLSVWTISIWNFDFCDNGISWLYTRYTNSSEINICEWEDMEYVMIHELWHHLWFSIDEETKKEYIDIYNKYWKDWSISVYWEKNYKEDFADTFSLIYKNYHNNRKYKHIKEWQKEKILRMSINIKSFVF